MNPAILGSYRLPEPLAAGNALLAYRAALEEALCWGWIDGRIRRVDERYFAQWFSPRRPRSIWSLANRRTVERLTAEGRMQPAGLARVAEAKEGGRWTSAYASKASPRMSADIRRAVEAGGAATAWKATCPSAGSCCRPDAIRPA